MLILAVLAANWVWATNPENTETIGGYTFIKDSENHLLITSVDDWNGLADAVAAGNDCSVWSFKMTTDIGPVNKTIGRQVSANKNDRKRFAGSFDGGSFVLTVELNSGDDWFEFNRNYCSPFAYTKNVTITNLHVVGTITTNGQWASGLIGSGDGSCTVKSCQISTTITSNYLSNDKNKANHGSFIGIAESTSSIIESWFDGAFRETESGDFQYSGGFIGMNKGAALFQDCLFNPSFCNVTATGSGQFAHHVGGSINSQSDRYYFLTPFGDDIQGVRLFTEPQSGFQCDPVVAIDGNTYYIIVGNDAWEDFQILLNQGGNVTLDKDLKAEASDKALVIANGVNVTLNLNGHSINRNLKDAKDEGYVIKVEQGGSLTLIDSNKSKIGTIKGGHNIGNGGGIYCEGSLTINGGSITGNVCTNHGGGICLNPADGEQKYNISNCNISSNRTTVNENGQGGGLYVANGIVTLTNCNLNQNNSKNYGGGICINDGDVTATNCNFNKNKSFANGCGGGIYLNDGSLTLDGGSVTENTSTKTKPVGMGVYVYGGTFSVKGQVVINDNSFKGQQGNVFLLDDEVICIAGELDAQAHIGVTKGTMNSNYIATITDGVITSKLGTNGSATNFFSDYSFIVNTNDNHEAFLSKSISIEVKGYGNDPQNSDHWILIASPLKGAVEPREIDGLMADEAEEYDLYRFNSAGEHLWENSKDASHVDDFVLANGTGYLYANKNDVTLTFEGEFNTNTSESVKLVYKENRNHPEFEGWNLVGNPFPYRAYLDRPFYKINTNGTDVEPVDNYNDYVAVAIEPCTGVMVCAATEDETITFSTTEPAGNRNQGGLKIAVASASLRDNTVEDKAIVSFNEGAMLGKFVFKAGNAQLSIPQGGKDYAIASASKQGEMPINFVASQNGDFTLTVSPEGVEMGYLHLIDNLTGADVDLLETPYYTFSARYTDYASRFRLVFSANDLDVLDDDFAFFTNGEILVNGTGTLQVVDALGRQLLTKQLPTPHSSLLTPNFPTGVYVLRLINENNVKTQKIVIK